MEKSKKIKMEIKDKKEQKQIKENAENINEIKEKNSNESSFQKTLLIILFIVFSSFLVVFIFKLNKFKKQEKEIKKINEEKQNEKKETKEDEKNIKNEKEKKEKKEKILDENLKKSDLVFSEKIKKYFVSNELLVKLKENEDINSLNDFLKANGAKSFELDEKNKIYKIKFNRALDETLLLEYIIRLNNFSSVENAVLNLLTEEEFNKIKYNF